MEEVKKIKRKRVIKAILSTVLVLAFLTILTLFSYKFIKTYNNKSKLLYSIVYYDDGVPGAKYDIDVYNDKIMLGSTHYCSALDCEATVDEKKDIKYSKENVNKFIRFVETHYDKVKIELHEKDLSEREKEIITGLRISELFFEIAIEDYAYKVEYSETEELGYTIYLKENNDILVFKYTINEDYDITNIEKYNVEFANDNKKLLKEYIVSLMKKDETVAYKSSTLRKDEKDLMMSVIKNDESLLNNSSKVKLAYTIDYSGINCLTPKLYLYSDNTYEFYYTFGIDNQVLIPKTGIYNDDILDIINTSEKTTDYTLGVYTILDNTNNKSYTISTSDIKINKLLKNLDISLSKCLEQQN